MSHQLQNRTSRLGFWTLVLGSWILPPLQTFVQIRASALCWFFCLNENISPSDEIKKQLSCELPFCEKGFPTAGSRAAPWTCYCGLNVCVSTSQYVGGSLDVGKAVSPFWRCGSGMETTVVITKIGSGETMNPWFLLCVQLLCSSAQQRCGSSSLLCGEIHAAASQGSHFFFLCAQFLLSSLPPLHRWNAATTVLMWNRALTGFCAFSISMWQLCQGFRRGFSPTGGPHRLHFVQSTVVSFGISWCQSCLRKGDTLGVGIVSCFVEFCYKAVYLLTATNMLASAKMMRFAVKMDWCVCCWKCTSELKVKYLLS